MNGTENMLACFRLVSSVHQGFWWCNDCFKATHLENPHATDIKCGRCKGTKIRYIVSEDLEKPKVIDFQI